MAPFAPKPARAPTPLRPPQGTLPGALAVAFLVGAAVMMASPRAASAQQTIGSCQVLPGTNRAVGRSVGGARVIYVSRPRLACEGGVRINADSMVTFEATGFNQLMGNVDFEDPNRRLLAREARYFDQVGRLEANGDVELTEKVSGNVVEGQNLLYLRASPQLNRTVEELTVWGGRAHALLYPSPPTADAPPPPGARDSVRLGVSAREAVARGEEPLVVEDEEEAGPRTPYDVVADRIYIRGEEYFRATGRVFVTRDSLDATADSLQYVQARERLFLQGNATVKQDRFDLTGQEILILLPGDTIRTVEARGAARVLGEELDLAAPFIRMGFTAGALDALWAVPLRPGQRLEGATGDRTLPAELDSLDLVRPEARSTDFHMVADSLEVLAPGEVLERLFATGTARAVSSARDTLNTESTPEIIRKDWIEGDTVVAFFTRAAPVENPDSTTYVLDRLEARVGARSLYRLDPADDAEADPPGEDPATEEGAVEIRAAPVEAGEPLAPVTDTLPSPDPGMAVHYVIADEIIIVFKDGEVERMEVKGLEQGLYLDPRNARRRSGGGGP